MWWMAIYFTTALFIGSVANYSGVFYKDAEYPSDDEIFIVFIVSISWPLMPILLLGAVVGKFLKSKKVRL